MSSSSYRRRCAVSSIDMLVITPSIRFRGRRPRPACRDTNPLRGAAARLGPRAEPGVGRPTSAYLPVRLPGIVCDDREPGGDSRMRPRTPTLALLLGVVQQAAAHHAFAPHFDSDKPVVITGTVIELERRNPHAYLHVSAADENGRIREYVCESHGITQLTRNGIRPELLPPGTVVTLRGSQARRDPYGCFFTSIELEDGRVLDVNGPRGTRPARDEIVRHDIYGTWMRESASSTPSGDQPMMNFMTPAGEAAVAAYDPFTDDPTFRCNPVSIRRVWFAPGTPLSMSRDGDNIILRLEWMDVERIVHLDVAEHPADGPRTTLGHSS